MKKILLALTLIVPSMGYVLYLKDAPEEGSTEMELPLTEIDTLIPELETASKAVPATTAASPVKGNAPSTSNTASPNTSSGATIKKYNSPYRDGTFTGSPAEEPYGTVQVAVVVSGGRITQVKLLQTPRGDSTTNYINAQALPMLVQETIAAQSANIDAISGASLTSPAYLDTLQSALAAARA